MIEVTHVVKKAKQYNHDTGILQFWDSYTNGLRTFPIKDLADIGKRVYDTRKPVR